MNQSLETGEEQRLGREKQVEEEKRWEEGMKLMELC